MCTCASRSPPPWVASELQDAAAHGPSARTAFLSSDVLAQQGWDVRSPPAAFAMGAVQTKPNNTSTPNKKDVAARPMVQEGLQAAARHVLPPRNGEHFEFEAPSSTLTMAVHEVLTMPVIVSSKENCKSTDVGKLLLPFWLQRSGLFAPRCEPAPSTSHNEVYMLPLPARGSSLTIKQEKAQICEMLGAISVRFVAGDGEFCSEAPQGKFRWVCVLATSSPEDSPGASDVTASASAAQDGSSGEDTYTTNTDESGDDNGADGSPSEDLSNVPEVLVCEMSMAAPALGADTPPAPLKLNHSHSSNNGTRKKREVRRVAARLAQLSGEGQLPPLRRGMLIGLLNLSTVPAPAPVAGEIPDGDHKKRKLASGASKAAPRATTRLAVSMVAAPPLQSPERGGSLLQAVSQPFMVKTGLSAADILHALAPYSSFGVPGGAACDEMGRKGTCKATLLAASVGRAPLWTVPPLPCVFHSAGGGGGDRLPAHPAAPCAWALADTKACLAEQLGYAPVHPGIQPPPVPPTPFPPLAMQALSSAFLHDGMLPTVAPLLSVGSGLPQAFSLPPGSVASYSEFGAEAYDVADYFGYDEA